MYGKIFESIYEGTLYGNWEAIVTFQQMLVLCNENGIFDMTIPAMSARTSIPADILSRGISHLERPDPHSRTPGEDGRRIILLDDHRPWGWSIVNHRKYRNMVSRAEKNEADRVRMAEKRKKNNNVADSSEASRYVAEVAHANADAEATTKADATLGGKKPPRGKDLSAAVAPAAEEVPPTRATEKSYRLALRDRYGVDPGPLNQKQRSQLATFLKRVPTDDAPKIAEFYVQDNRQNYVQAMHPVDFLLRDAESIKLAWLRGRGVTVTESRQADKTAARGAAWGPLADEARRREGGR